MAPRRGGGSSSGGGSSGVSCNYCSVPITLDSDYYSDPANLAALAFSFILVISALGALFMVLQKSWLKPDGKRDGFLFWTFIIVALGTIIQQIMLIIDVFLHLRDAEVTFGYYITYIVRDFFSRLSDVALYLLVLRILEDVWMKTRAITKSFLRTINGISWFALLALSAVGWGYYVRSLVALLRDGYVDDDVLIAPVEVSYTVLALVLSIETVVLAVTVFSKIASRKISILLVVLSVALWLYSLIWMIYTIRANYAYYSFDNSTAYSRVFIALICGIIIFVSLGLLSQATHKAALESLTGDVHGYEGNSYGMHNGASKLHPDTSVAAAGPTNTAVPVYNSNMAYHNHNTYPSHYNAGSAAAGHNGHQSWQPQPDYQTQPYYTAQGGAGYDLPNPPQQAQMQAQPQQRFYQGGSAYASVPQQHH